MKIFCTYVAISVISCWFLASGTQYLQLAQIFFQGHDLYAKFLFLFLQLILAQSESGKCSFYGAVGEVPEGHPTYCGEFHRLAMDTAHWNVPNMPCGTRLRVKNTDNGQTVEVRVNDKGPNGRPGYILDLTYAAFGQIADHDKGVINCSYEVI